MIAIPRTGTAVFLGALALASSACGGTHRDASATAAASSVPTTTTAESSPPATSTSAARSADKKKTAPVAGVRLPPGVVAEVGTVRITARRLEHWGVVRARMAAQSSTPRPLAPGAVPDPPSYDACITYLARRERVHPALNRSQLKKRCMQERKASERSALQMLIDHYWAREEARRAGVKVTAAEVEALLHHWFPTQAQLHRYLTFTGLGMPDELFVVENEVLRTDWYRAVLPAFDRLGQVKPESEQLVGEIDAEETHLNEAVVRRWAPRTICAASYELGYCWERPSGR